MGLLSPLLERDGGSAGVHTVTKSDADLGILKVTSWADADTGGSAAARPLDLVVPNVSAGQWVTLSTSQARSGHAGWRTW